MDTWNSIFNPSTSCRKTWWSARILANHFQKCRYASWHGTGSRWSNSEASSRYQSEVFPVKPDGKWAKDHHCTKSRKPGYGISLSSQGILNMNRNVRARWSPGILIDGKVESVNVSVWILSSYAEYWFFVGFHIRVLFWTKRFLHQHIVNKGVRYEIRTWQGWTIWIWRPRNH